MNNYNITDLALKLLKKHSGRKPYNIFTEWGMKENDHTKLLLSLLGYNNDHKAYQYPLLYSFLCRFAKGRDKMVHYKRLENVEIRFSPKFSKDFIDGLISFERDDRKYAIIIENKVFHAPDQKNQIRKYIYHVNTELKVPLENIWVFYITGDSSKEVSPASYNVDGEVEGTNLGSRFVWLNYSVDILSWLKEEILNLRVYPESVTSVVRVYVDYLENDLFCTNALADEQETLLKLLHMPTDIVKLTAQQIEKIYDLQKEVASSRDKSDDESVENPKVVNTLYCVISSIIKRLENMAFGRFEQVSLEILNTHYSKFRKVNLNWKVGHRGIGSKNGYVQLRLVDEWNTVHIEWEKTSTWSFLYDTDYNIALHIEDRRLQQEWIEELKHKGWSKYIKYNRVRFPVRVGKTSLAKMSESELKEYLTSLYTVDLSAWFSMLVDKIDTYKVAEV